MRKYPQNAVSSKLYSIWNGMKNRCYTRSSGSYKDYGAKGVRICDEWHYDYMKFYKWAIENGYKEGLTIDRIDFTDDYKPSNCRWATTIQQGNNRSDNILLSFNGITHTITEWSRITCLSKATIQYRKYQGWSDEKILSTPLRMASYPILNKSDVSISIKHKRWHIVNDRKYWEENGLLIRDDFSGIVHFLGLKCVEKALMRYDKIYMARIVCQRLARIIKVKQLKQE